MSNHDMQGNDYVSVAKFRLEGVHDWQSEEGSTDATNLAAIIDAQVAATLALAYEQRTANLIALMADESIKADAERFSRRFPDGAGVEISALIRERLGLV